MQLYWGDLHNHCGISYGFGSLENALKQAESHLDFCCITGHAMWPDIYKRNEETTYIVDYHERGFRKLHDNWKQVQDTINAHNTENLVTFQSYEMHSSAFGDHHLISPDPDLPLIYRDLPADLVHDCKRRAVVIPHHIGYTPGYRGISWDHFDSSISPFVEVYSKHGCAMREYGPFPYYHDMGPLDPRNTVEEGLSRGYRFSFAGSTDHHAGFPGSYGDGLAGVWAEDKSREGLWDALLKGHVYAVTGDRISCIFNLNDAMMGDAVTADRRCLSFHCEGDAPISMVVIRKNGDILASVVPRKRITEDPENRYKLRLELGWSNQPEVYHWEGELRVDSGELLRVQPYYRGRNALSPQDKEADAADGTNDLDNGCGFENDRAWFRCDTVCNISTLHPQTDAFVFEVRGDSDTKVRLTVNGLTQEHRLGDLLQAGYTEQMKPWHSHAYKMYTAIPAAQCCAQIKLDDMPEQKQDVYQAEVIQSNGCRAFVSPIFVRQE